MSSSFSSRRETVSSFVGYTRKVARNAALIQLYDDMQARRPSAPSSPPYSLYAKNPLICPPTLISSIKKVSCPVGASSSEYLT